MPDNKCTKQYILLLFFIRNPYYLQWVFCTMHLLLLSIVNSCWVYFTVLAVCIFRYLLSPNFKLEERCIALNKISSCVYFTLHFSLPLIATVQKRASLHWINQYKAWNLTVLPKSAAFLQHHFSFCHLFPKCAIFNIISAISPVDISYNLFIIQYTPVLLFLLVK